eukprot:TRINITY_DN5283_c0_g1_i1.p1 TRINITY_DN5283_c0_g1~~TRINITY_DN5283_c0_g1_i1.p1  ORF type:complete len:205 (-),score=66.57 TRINITY_DN5283_c0_g1_i1:13-627(-)
MAATAGNSNSNSNSSVAASFAPIYLNIVILNKDEVVKAQVSEKVGPLRFGLMAKFAASAANTMVSDEKFASTIAQKLIDTIPEKVADMGIKLSLSKSFQRGSYVVLRAQITEVAHATLLSRAKGEEFAKKFAELQTLLDFFGVADAKATMAAKINTMVQEGLLTKLEEVLPAKLAESGNIEVTVTAKKDSDQAEFFFSFLSSLN